MDSSGRGRSEYANGRPDDQDGPAPPGPGAPPPSAPDPGDRIRRALSRNTMMPEDVPSTSSTAASGGSTANSASQGLLIPRSSCDFLLSACSHNSRHTATQCFQQ